MQLRAVWAAQGRPVAAGLAIAIAYAVLAGYAVLYGRAWTDEATYVVKSWWYVNGVVAPYSDQDATWYMPLFFYQVGFLEKLFGTGLVAGRSLSAAIGGLSAIPLFLICRRLTGNTVIAVLAAAIYLLCPTTAYYFATVAPLATVALLLLLGVWLILIGMDRLRVWISAVLGLLFCALFFYRQNMILAVGLMLPTYILAIRQQRARHAAIVIGVTLAASALLLALFPAKLGFYAMRLPGLVPIFSGLHLLPRNLQLIQDGTDNAALLDVDLASLSWENFAISFLLPFLGTIGLALASFGLARRALLVLPAAFFVLALSHFVGSAGYCSTCALMYTNYFVGIGAVAAALALAAVWQASRTRGWPALPITLLAAVAAMGLNAFGSLIPVSAEPNPYRLFPEPMVHQYGAMREIVEIDQFAPLIAAATPPDKPVLVLHTQPALPYAVFRAGRQVAVQSLNIRQSFRRLRPDLDPAMRGEVLHAVEAESLWTPEVLQRWLADGFDTVVLQESSGIADYPTAAMLEAGFELRARAVFLGWNVAIFVRKPKIG